MVTTSESSSSFHATLLHATETLKVLYKPPGMPISGKKPQAVLNAPFLHGQTPVVVAAVPRPISGPVILSFSDAGHPVSPDLHKLSFTFFAIVHAAHDTRPSLPGATIVNERTVFSTSGPLSCLRIDTPSPGQGMRKQLLRQGTPAVGTIDHTRSSRCVTRGVYIACTRLQIPSLRIDLAVRLPNKFDTLLKKEEHYGRMRLTRDAERQVVDDGVRRVRFSETLFRVGGCMQPRESTELVARTAAEYLASAAGKHRKPGLLDLGTGCGAILLTAILQSGVDASGVGIDNSEDAIRTARANVAEHGLQDVEILYCDFRELPDVGRFDVAVSNPPYLTKWEVQKDTWFFKDDPEEAILAGVDGMDGYRAIAKCVGSVLKDDGVLVLEIGANRDINRVIELFKDHGLVFVNRIKDLRGFDRCLVLRKPSLIRFQGSTTFDVWESSSSKIS